MAASTSTNDFLAFMEIEEIAYDGANEVLHEVGRRSLTGSLPTLQTTDVATMLLSLLFAVSLACGQRRGDFL